MLLNKRCCLNWFKRKRLMYEHPDSALGVLQGMKVPAVSDKLQNATWALLTVQAKYKNYKEELADSTLINIAYDYFMKQNNPQRKAMVLYYKGVLYEKADKKNEAQESYLKAIEEVEKTKDYQLAHLIYSSIGNIYLYNSLNEYALQMFKQSLHYAKLSENKNYNMFCNTKAGCMEIYDKVLECIETYKQNVNEAHKKLNQ